MRRRRWTIPAQAGHWSKESPLPLLGGVLARWWPCQPPPRSTPQGACTRPRTSWTRSSRSPATPPVDAEAVVFGGPARSVSGLAAEGEVKVASPRRASFLERATSSAQVAPGKSDLSTKPRGDAHSQITRNGINTSTPLAVADTRTLGVASGRPRRWRTRRPRS